jgi:pimeloyl-ACP methyl ester carboxylesterase
MSQWITLRDGRRLVYHRRGDGPLLVCHPGGPGLGSSYFSDLAGLAANFELLILEPRGTSDSTRPGDPKAYQLEDYVADLEELREQLSIDQMLLLGHSHGGFVAQVYAADHPDHVARLVLANTAARINGEAAETAWEAALQRHAAEPWYHDARQALDDETAGRYRDDDELGVLLARELPLYFSRYDDRAAAYIAAGEEEPPNGDALRVSNAVLSTFDLRAHLPSIHCPTLVLTGEVDFITPPAAAAEIAGLIPDAQLTIIPSCGHFSFIEAPGRFNREVRGFLSRRT